MNRQTQAKQDLDWKSLDFSYKKTDSRFHAAWENGVWSDGELVDSEIMQMHEGAPVLHYAQSCFEGLKAFTSPEGKVLLFRPDLNDQRMQETSDRLLMPRVPTELFMKGVIETIKANLSWVPPYGTGASLYIRPFLIGSGENLGLKPARRYDFRVFVSPVGPYYKAGGLPTIKLAVTNFDRAAPLGTGHVKTGANYAGGLLATKTAQDLGANEALYLDAGSRKFLEEAGSANIVLSMKGDRFVTPQSPSILPSVTRRSVMTLAEDQLGLQCEERPVEFLKEVSEIEEFGCCGTAAVLSPVSSVLIDDNWISFGEKPNEPGPVMTKLYNLLTKIQLGEMKDPYGWTLEV